LRADRDARGRLTRLLCGRLKIELLRVVAGSESNWFQGVGVCWRGLRLGPRTGDGSIEAGASNSVWASRSV
jgi:hypothetical protein